MSTHSLTQRRLPSSVLTVAALALCSLMGAGCARVAAVSEVRADGAMTRTLTIHGTQPEAEAKGGESGSMSFGPNLKDMIALPTTAGGWKVTQTREDKSGVVVTATRTVAPGESLHNDLGLKNSGSAGASGLMVENTAIITKSGSQIVYREVLHWHGPRPKDLAAPDPDMLASLKRALPANLASDTPAVQKTCAALQGELWRIIFGPGDPLLSVMLFHPDLAEYRLTHQLQGAVRRTLVSAYGSRLSESDLNVAVARISADAAASTTTKTASRSKPGQDSNSDNTPPVALLLRVKLPGKVTTTNGQVDAESGEVYWALYSEAPAVEDVVLTATCDTAAR